jgi:hypothetical protein
VGAATEGVIVGAALAGGAGRAPAGGAQDGGEDYSFGFPGGWRLIEDGKRHSDGDPAEDPGRPAWLAGAALPAADSLDGDGVPVGVGEDDAPLCAGVGDGGQGEQQRLPGGHRPEAAEVRGRTGTARESGPGDGEVEQPGRPPGRLTGVGACADGAGAGPDGIGERSAGFGRQVAGVVRGPG